MHWAVRVPFYRHIARIFREGVRVGSEDAGGSGGMLPWKDFRNFGLP